MSWLVCILILAIAAALVVAAFVLPDARIADWCGYVGLAIGAVVLLAMMGMGIRSLIREWDVKECRGYAVYGDRVSKFVDYNYWSWECLVWADGFGWIPKDQLRNVEP